MDVLLKTNSVTMSIGIRLAACFSISLRRAPSRDYIYLAAAPDAMDDVLPPKKGSGNRHRASNHDDSGGRARHRDRPCLVRALSIHSVWNG